MSTPSQERAMRIAYNLRILGVSRDGVQRLLDQYPYDLIEKQLTYLPYRRAKRPEAMIVESIRKNYSAPKTFFYASTQTNAPAAYRPVDQGAERAFRPDHAEDSGYRAPGAAGPHEANLGVEPGSEDGDPPVQDADEADG